jgi:hypothetical protein
MKIPKSVFQILKGKYATLAVFLLEKAGEIPPHGTIFDCLISLRFGAAAMRALDEGQYLLCACSVPPGCW